VGGDQSFRAGGPGQKEDGCGFERKGLRIQKNLPTNSSEITVLTEKPTYPVGEDKKGDYGGKFIISTIKPTTYHVP